MVMMVFLDAGTIMPKAHFSAANGYLLLIAPYI
jgi:hypothetical protein